LIIPLKYQICYKKIKPGNSPPAPLFPKNRGEKVQIKSVIPLLFKKEKGLGDELV
jgi:hypothetical protein